MSQYLVSCILYLVSCILFIYLYPKHLKYILLSDDFLSQRYFSVLKSYI